MFTKTDIESLYNLSIMRSLVLILAKISKEDSERAFKALDTRRSCEQIALDIAKFKGRQEMLSIFLDHENLISFLDEYIIEETNRNG